MLASSSGSPRPSVGDIFFRSLAGFAALFVLLVLFGVAVALLWRSLPAFQHFGWSFLWTGTWDPVRDLFGGWIPIAGTLISSAIALLIAVPLAYGVALFVTSLAPAWLGRPVGSAIELLAAIPSIIYGMWGLFVFAPLFAKAEPWISAHIGTLPYLGVLFRGPPMGIGMLTAGLILAIMVLPFIASIMRDVFAVVPPMLKESAYALGATPWEVQRHVVLAYTRSAVLGGIFLGLGRALGETMAVTFVIGNAHQLSSSLLKPGNSIAALLANEFAEASSPLYQSSLLALGFILFVMTLVILILARLLLWRLETAQGKAGL
ncbi:MAG: phosphate ABC transporter permease subunit PstC [Acidithiobacillus sp.]|uniref:phosphate ABC transporter permease subunit PstC n=1 Tax=Acidithiobacillus sp. TaxID=1872118 RepID=UPI0025BC414B|nr:phosphate ABC transporter permease subunit PstC [Acidithiobacillus sp.]